MLTVILSLLFFVPAAIEGMGLLLYRQTFIWFYTIVPVILYVALYFTRAKLRLPPKATLLALGFFMLTSMSTSLYSLDKQPSVELFLYYITLFLIFLFSYNNRRTMKTVTVVTVTALGFLFSVSHFILKTPLHEKQTVLPFFGSHNHLGDFLGMAILILLPFVRHRIFRIFSLALIAFFFIMTVFSFSRSAYFALFIVGLVYLIGKRRAISRKYLFASFVGLSVLLFVFVLTSSKGIGNTPLDPARKIAVQRFNLFPRDILSDRDVFFKQAADSIRKHPLFGVGGGNFVKISLTNNRDNTFTDSAHNIILEVAAEQGIPAAGILLAVGVLFLIHAVRKKDIWGYALVYLLINFQTDYTYTIYLFPLFTMILAGISYDEPDHEPVPVWLYGTTSLFLLAIFFCYATSMLLIRMNRPIDAMRLYPLNKTAHIQAILEETDRKTNEQLTANALKLSPNDVGIMLASAQYHLNWGNNRKALQIYEKMYQTNPLISFNVVRRIYALKKELVSKKEADAFLIKVAISYHNLPFVPDYFKEEFDEFCRQNIERRCWETRWD